jgi:hypothetical protein
MKPLISLLLLASCCPQGDEQPQIQVNAVIVGLHKPERGSAYTYLKDDHGHRDDVRGIWGQEGDEIPVMCHKGILYVR